MATVLRGGFGIGTLMLLAACVPATGPEQEAAGARTADRPVAARAAALAAVAPAAGPQPEVETRLPTDCRRLVAAVLAGEAGARLPVLALDAADPLRLDLPGLYPIGTGSPGRCLLLVDRIVAEGGTVTEIGRETVEGRRRIGTRRRLNPEYRRLERELAAARREARRGRGTDTVLATGDPSLDLLGMVAETLLAGGRALFGGDRVAELEDRLAATPPFVETPVHRRYRYELRRFLGERRGRVRIALLDRARDRGWTTEVRLAERRNFAILRGRDPEDDTPLPADAGEPVDARTLEAWRDAPPAAPARVLLRHLAAALRAPALPLTRERLLAAWRETTPAGGGGEAEPAPPPRSPSVVVLRRDGEAAGLGFYVAPEMIVTLARFLGESILVPVEAAPGLVTYGVVEARDPESGLVLVWLPRRGIPLALAAETGDGGAVPLLPAVATATALRAGAPLTRERRVVGVAGEDPFAAPISLATLRGFLDRLKSGGLPTTASR